MSPDGTDGVACLLTEQTERMSPGGTDGAACLLAEQMECSPAHYSPRTRSSTTKLVKKNISDLPEAFTICTEFIRDAESSISFYFPLAYLGINLR